MRPRFSIAFSQLDPLPRGLGFSGIASLLLLIGGNASAESVATDFTLELWLRGDLGENPGGPIECGPGADWTHGHVVVDREHAEAGGRDLGLSLGDGRLAFGVVNEDRDSLTVCGSSRVLDGEWHHVAAGRRAVDGMLWIWVDGELDASADGPDGEIAGSARGATSDPGGDGSPGSLEGLGSRGGLGSLGSPGRPTFRGSVHDVRVSSLLRYLEPFAPPPAPSGPAANPVALGMPSGAVLEAYPNPGLGQTILFARFPESRTGPAVLTIHDASGRFQTAIESRLERGSAMILWDGTAEGGKASAPGVYSAKLVADGTMLSTKFVLP